MVLEAHILLPVTEPDFLEKIPIRQKLPQMVKNGPKTRFLEFFSFVSNLCKTKVLMVH